MSPIRVPDEVARTLAHTGDPDASHEAAANLDRVRDAKVKGAILELLAEVPRADFELKRAYARLWQINGWPHLADLHSVARRRSELKTEGLVRAQLMTNGKQYRIPSPAGATATVWELVPSDHEPAVAA